MLLDDGTWFELTTPRFDRLRQLIEEARALHDPNTDGGLRLSPYQVGLMADLEELAIEQRHSNRWRQRVRGLLAVAAAVDVAVPDGLRAELRPYQREGLSWLARLWEAGLGGVLADDMGLGKTLQTIALLERARQRGDLDTHPVLVVAPASVVGTWAAEAARFAPELAVTTITATKARRGSRLADEVRGAHVVVTSYTLLRIEAEHYLALRWRGLVLDEAQYVKNPRSRTHQVVRDLPGPCHPRHHRHPAGELSRRPVVDVRARRPGPVPPPGQLRRAVPPTRGERRRHRGPRRCSGPGSDRSCCAAPRPRWCGNSRRRSSRWCGWNCPLPTAAPTSSASPGRG